jgi:hypothetical protein
MTSPLVPAGQMTDLLGDDRRATVLGLHGPGIMIPLETAG